MLNWLMSLFGNNKIDKKRKELKKLQTKAFDAQRKGDLSLSGMYHLEAEALENEISELTKEE